MKAWFSASELVGFPGLPPKLRSIQHRAKRDGWHARPRSGRGGGFEYHIDSLPAVTQAALAGSMRVETLEQDTHEREEQREQVDAEAAWRHFERLPPGDRNRAHQRLLILQAYEHLRERGHTKQQTEQEIQKAYDVSGPTVRRWWSQVRGVNRHHWLPFLATRYQGKQTSAACSEAAWRHFLTIYLKMEAPSLSICHEQVARIAKDKGWQWPTERTIRRRVEREIPWQVVVLERQGADALRQRVPMQDRDRSVLHAMEALNTDGHVFDWWIRWPDDEVRRPTIVAWQDLYSNFVLSWRADKSENTDGIRLSFADAIGTYGVPNAVHADNGYGYASKVMSGGTPTRHRGKIKEDDPLGVFTQLNIRVHWTIPGRGSSKPIERMWGELEDRLRARPELNGAWAGNAPGVKPVEYSIKPVDLDVFLRVVDEEIRAYNQRTDRASQTAQRRSYEQTFRESYERAVVAKPTAEQLRVCMLAAESVRVAKKDSSIRLVTGGNRYWNEALGPYAGQRVTVRFDPQQLHESVHVYSQEGAYVCEAACWERIGWNDSEAAREQARLESQHRKAARKAAEALRRMSAHQARENLPESEPETETPQPAATRLVRQIRSASSADAAQERATADQEAFDEAFENVATGLDAQLKRKAKSQL